MVHPCRLGFPLPVILTRPNLAFWAAFEVAFADALHSARVVLLRHCSARNHGLEVGIEGVQFIVGGGGRRHVRRTAVTHFGAERHGAGRRRYQCVSCGCGGLLVGDLSDGCDGQRSRLFICRGRHFFVLLRGIGEQFLQTALS